MVDCCGCGLTGWIVTTGVVILAALLFSKKDPPKLAGVYSQPGKFYWLKVVIFYLLIKFRNLTDKKKKGNKDNNVALSEVDKYDAGYGTNSRSSPTEMDKVQPLSDHFQAIDAIYFNGANSKGFSIVTGTARRPHGVVNGFLILRIPEIGYLVSPKFPDTILYGGTEKFFGAEGFNYQPVVPMKHWKLEYKGDLKFPDDPTKKVKVHFEADWKSELEYFDYDTMIPAWTMARGIALETWSREYFQALKEAHQSHYEQHGDLIGKVEVDGKTHEFRIPSMRDHSYGKKRNWKLLHRYMIHMFNLEDGRRFDVGTVCHPCVTSNLEIGYMYDHNGSLYALEVVDLPLPYHGENGELPQDYGMKVKATNGHTYYIQVKVLDTQTVNIGWEWEAEIVERRCKFIVDGVEGYGISECMYRNLNGRPQEVKKTDPDWVKDIKTI